MNKKAVAFIGMLALCLALLCACADLPHYILLTGGERGTYYNIGNDISDMFVDIEDTEGEKDPTKYKAKISVRTSEGYEENINALKNGSADLAIVRADIAYSAINGSGVYEGKKMTGFSAIAALYGEAVHIVAKDGTKSLSELSGARISVGVKDSANAMIATQVLVAAGVKDYEKHELSLNESVTAFENGEIDAFFVISGAPTTTVSKLSSKARFVLVGLDDSVIEELCARHSYFRPCHIAKKTYNVLKTSINTVALNAVLLVSDNVDNASVYNITKRLAEDTYLMYHDLSAEITPKNMWTGLPVPLHDGAEKYYNEYLKELEKEEQKKNTTAADTGDVTSSPEETTAPETE